MRMRSPRLVSAILLAVVGRAGGSEVSAHLRGKIGGGWQRGLVEARPKCGMPAR